MPRRAHGRPLLRSRQPQSTKRKPRRNAALNALETAEKQNPDTLRIRQHRLGEIEDDSDASVTRADVDERSSKRRKIANTGGEGGGDEDIEEGSDLEGGKWHTGVNEDDEDSDLDSDEAFGESDEEKFADFTFRGSSAVDRPASDAYTRKKRAVNLDEHLDLGGDDNSEQDDLGDEAVDLATAWDMDDQEQRNLQKEEGRRPLKGMRQLEARPDTQNTDDDSSNASGQTSSEDEGSASDLSMSEDEADGDTAALRSFVEGLSSSQTGTAQKLRGVSQQSSGTSQPTRSSSQKLSAADLLQYVKDPTQRQSIKMLQSAERAGPSPYNGGIPGKLSAPLAKRQQDRLDRAAAYDKSKETLNRWIETVKQNRRAEHLSFPLADPAKASAVGQKQLIPLNQSGPVTDLENAINQIMQESGIENTNRRTTDQKETEEELSQKKMTIEDVRAQRAELRLARELMFREEIRAKRIKKIKSKAFRRVHRKEKDKIEAQQREALAAAGLLNSDDEREKNDRRRAEERMGARHRESKWAKSVKQSGRATWDDDARTGVTVAARRDEELRRRISGKAVQASDASDMDSNSDSDYDSDTARGAMTNKLKALNGKADLGPHSKLTQMAFMQRAEAARKAENDAETRKLLLAMNQTADSVSDSDLEDRESVGRQRFGTRATGKKSKASEKRTSEFEARMSEDEEADERGTTQVEVNQDGIENALSATLDKGVNMRNGVGKKHPSVMENSYGQLRSRNTPPSIARGYLKAEIKLGEYESPSESEYERANEVDLDETKAALASSIFAGPDDAIQEFRKEKQEIVEEEGDQIVDNTLPGWGSWTGAGVSKREQRKGKGRFLSKIEGVAAERRQDAKLERVIVNEKRIKKNGRYLATELPHPFESVQQYERSLRLPVGPEWSTANHYQDSIKPQVLVKQGSVIRPIAKPIT